MSWTYDVRPGDRHDRREHEDATTVIALFMGSYAREVGTYTSRAVATEIAAALNNRSGEQVR